MPSGWPSMDEKQRIQPTDSHQKTHSGFYLQNLKTILLYFQLPIPLWGTESIVPLFEKGL